MGLAIRQHISIDDMKQMSYVSLMNILISSIEKDEKNATEDDIRRMFG